MLVSSQDMVLLPVHGELSVSRERDGEWKDERVEGDGARWKGDREGLTKVKGWRDG